MAARERASGWGVGLSWAREGPSERQMGREWSGGGPPGPAHRPGSASPAPSLEQPLQVLPARDQQRFDIHVVEPAQAEAAQAVPVLRLAEERLHPDLALAH